VTTTMAGTDAIIAARGGGAPGNPGHAWRRHLIVASALGIGAIAATWSIWARIFAFALEREEQSHSLLAVPVAAWLVWCRRARLARLGPRFSSLGPVVVLVGWGSAVWGFRGGLDFAIHLGALLIVLGGLIAAVGWRVFRGALPALGALFLVFPVPGRLRAPVAAPLQEWSAAVSASLIDLVGLEITRSGNLLSINGVDVAVAEACNGMRMVSALAVITFAFVFTLPLRAWARLLILALSPVLALAVNIARLVPTVLFYGYSSNETARTFHDLSGWASLLLAVLMLQGLVLLLRWLELPIDPHAGESASGVAPVVASGARAPRVILAAPAVAALALAAAATIGGFDARKQPGINGYFARVSQTLGATSWQVGGAVGLDQPIPAGATDLLRPNAALSRRYEDPLTGSRFDLTVIHCADARDLEGHYPPVCYPAHGWRMHERRAISLGYERIAAVLYTFVRSADAGEQHLRVVSFFALPSTEAPYSASMGAVERASRSAAAAGLGAAHILIAFGGDTPETVISETGHLVVAALSPALRAITQGLAP
jgi:exosortase